MLLFILIFTTAGFIHGIIIQRTVYENQGATGFSLKGMRPQCASKCVMQLRHSHSSGVKYTGFTTGPCFCSTVAISEEKEPGKGYAMKRDVIWQYVPPAISQRVNGKPTHRYDEHVPFALVNGSRMAVTLSSTSKNFRLNWVVNKSNSLLHIIALNKKIMVAEFVNNVLMDRELLGPYTYNVTDLQDFSVIFYTGYVHVYCNGKFLKNFTTELNSSAVTTFRVHPDNQPVIASCNIYSVEWNRPVN